jgi:hypothetical protein
VGAARCCVAVDTLSRISSSKRPSGMVRSPNRTVAPGTGHWCFCCPMAVYSNRVFGLGSSNGPERKVTKQTLPSFTSVLFMFRPTVESSSGRRVPVRRLPRQP